MLEEFKEYKNNVENSLVRKLKEIVTPREYQIEAIKLVTETLEKHDRCQLLMACGTGKTITSLMIKEQLLPKEKPGLTICFLPSLSLVKQFQAEWDTFKSNSYISQIVCSEGDIVESLEYNQDEDESILEETDIKGVTTDMGHVVKFLNLSKSKTISKTIFCTYHSMNIVGDALKVANINADLVFCDEAHRTAGIDKSFGDVHDNEKVPSHKRIYMTATPKLVSPILKKKITEDDTNTSIIFDMSDEKTFGPVAYQLGFREAIEKEILCDYEIITVSVDLKKSLEMINQLHNTQYTLDYFDSLEGTKELQVLSLLKAKAELGDKLGKIICYNNTIASSQLFIEMYRNFENGTDVEKCFTAHIDGTSKPKVREHIFNQFEKHANGVLSNSKVLTEGINIPSINGVYYADPKSSLVDIVQSAGRALRKSEKTGKEKGYIVVPIFVSDEDSTKIGNINNNGLVEKLKNLINVISALGQEDDLLKAQCIDTQNSAKSPKSKKGSKYYPNNIIKHIGLSDEIMKNITLEVINRAGFDRRLRIPIDRKIDLLSDFLLHNKRLPKLRERIDIDSNGEFAIGDFLSRCKWALKYDSGAKLSLTVEQKHKVRRMLEQSEIEKNDIIDEKLDILETVYVNNGVKYSIEEKQIQRLSNGEEFSLSQFFKRIKSPSQNSFQLTDPQKKRLDKLVEIIMGNKESEGKNKYHKLFDKIEEIYIYPNRIPSTKDESIIIDDEAFNCYRLIYTMRETLTGKSRLLKLTPEIITRAEQLIKKLDAIPSLIMDEKISLLQQYVLTNRKLPSRDMIIELKNGEIFKIGQFIKYAKSTITGTKIEVALTELEKEKLKSIFDSLKKNP
jgi:superfamily II DNA or RNA helicase